MGEIRYGFSLANRDKGTGAVSDFPEDGRELSEPSVPSESKVLEKSSTQSKEARMGTLGRQDRERVEGIKRPPFNASSSASARGFRVSAQGGENESEG